MAADPCLPACLPPPSTPLPPPHTHPTHSLQSRSTKCAQRFLGLSRDCKAPRTARIFSKTDRKAAVVWRLKLASAGTPHVASVYVVPVNKLVAEIYPAPGPGELCAASDSVRGKAAHRAAPSLCASKAPRSHPDLTTAA